MLFGKWYPASEALISSTRDVHREPNKVAWYLGLYKSGIRQSVANLGYCWVLRTGKFAHPPEYITPDVTPDFNEDSNGRP